MKVTHSFQVVSCLGEVERNLEQAVCCIF